MREDIKQQFLALYDQYADAIYRHCFFRIFQKQQAEDLAQETFTKMWVYLSAGNEVRNMTALLYKIANNLIIDGVRKKKEEHLDALLESKQIEEPSYPGHRAIEVSASFSHLMEHVQKLPDLDRRMVIMRYVDDLDPKDIAEITGLSPNNVSVRLHRIIKKLQELQ